LRQRGLIWLHARVNGAYPTKKPNDVHLIKLCVGVDTVQEQ